MMKDRTVLVILLIIKEIIMKRFLIFGMICVFAGCMDTQSYQKGNNGRHDRGSSSHGGSHGGSQGDSQGRDNNRR